MASPCTDRRSSCLGSSSAHDPLARKRQEKPYSSGFIGYLTLDYSSDWTREERHYSYQLSHINRIAKDINARPEVLIFDAKDWIIQRFSKLTGLIAQLNELGKVQWRKQRPPFIVRHIFPLLQSGARALLYLIVAFQPDYFSMPLSQLSFLESSMEGVFSSIGQLRRIVSDSLIRDMFQIRNLFECMNITSKVAIPDNPVPYKSHPKGMKIQVKDLTFGYRKDSPPVIKDVNFTIDPGEIVSIVGYNGSGKVPAFHFSF
jgi:ABC-type multidrug transport system fused ATPase/permease subunit